MSARDDSEVVVHSNDVDAPVLLLVPHTWHLEAKAFAPVLPDPEPCTVAPSAPRPLRPRTPFTFHAQEAVVGKEAVLARLRDDAESFTLLLPLDATIAITRKLNDVLDTVRGHT